MQRISPLKNIGQLPRNTLGRIKTLKHALPCQLISPLGLTNLAREICEKWSSTQVVAIRRQLSGRLNFWSMKASDSGTIVPEPSYAGSLKNNLQAAFIVKCWLTRFAIGCWPVIFMNISKTSYQWQFNSMLNAWLPQHQRRSNPIVNTFVGTAIGFYTRSTRFPNLGPNSRFGASHGLWAMKP